MFIFHNVAFCKKILHCVAKTSGTMPIFHAVIGIDQQGRRRIMCLNILTDSGRGVVGAAIIHTDINAGHTDAFIPLILVLAAVKPLI